MKLTFVRCSLLLLSAFLRGDGEENLEDNGVCIPLQPQANLAAGWIIMTGLRVRILQSPVTQEPFTVHEFSHLPTLVAHLRLLEIRVDVGAMVRSRGGPVRVERLIFTSTRSGERFELVLQVFFGYDATNTALVRDFMLFIARNSPRCVCAYGHNTLAVLHTAYHDLCNVRNGLGVVEITYAVFAEDW